MSSSLKHLNSGGAVKRALRAEKDRLVIIRFGRDKNSVCMEMDENLASIAALIKHHAVVYVVDIDKVPNYNLKYELYDPCSTMFFFQNQHIMVDLGTGIHMKINWAIHDKQELIDIVETVYEGAREGREFVVSSWNHSIKHKY